MVQGVGFRYFVLKAAAALDLRGYVRNEYDGAVVGVAVGKEKDLQLFKQHLKAGPSRSRVEKVVFANCDISEIYSSFEIR